MRPWMGVVLWLACFVVWVALMVHMTHNPEPRYRVELWSGGRVVRTYRAAGRPEVGGFGQGGVVRFHEAGSGTYRELTGTVTFDAED